MLLPFSPARLAVVLLGDRLTGVVIRRDRVETFEIEADEPGAALRAELDARGVTARSVALGLARSSVTVKPVDLPPVPGEVRDMVRFELERHLPFVADDPLFDFLRLPSTGERDATGGTETTRALITAADRRVVDAAVRIATEARLRPVSVTVAAHDLLALASGPRDQRVVWGHVSREAVDLLFLENGALVLSRSVPATGETNLPGEITRSFGTVRWRGCDAVWLSGDAGPVVHTVADMGVPVTAPPWTAQARRQLAAIEHEPRGAVTLALAVATGRGIRPLDLIPDALRPQRLTRPQMWTAGVFAATLLLALAALLVPGVRDGRRLTALNREIARIEPEVRAVRSVLGDLERGRRLLATIDEIGASALRPLPVLRDLTDLLPSDAWLTTLALDAKGVELVGQAAAASTLIPLLENSPRLDRVEFASPVTRGRDKEQFRIRASWEAAPVPTSAPRAERGSRS